MRKATVILGILWLGLLAAGRLFGQEAKASGRELYAELAKPDLSGACLEVRDLVLKRDRVTMTFSGTFHFETPRGGAVRGAVFTGRGTFRADTPPGDFERQNLQRLIKMPSVETTFQTAVLRFSDDTFDRLGGAAARPGAVPPEAKELADQFGPRLLKETGANVAARLAVSLLNAEKGGVFVGQFDRGDLGRFTYFFDPQSRLLASAFGVNAGEKGIIFTYAKDLFDTEIWTAFHSLEDYASNRGEYADVNDLVKIDHYRMDVDVRKPKEKLGLRVRLDATSLSGGVAALPLLLNDGLGEYDNVRLKKAMRVKSARLADGPELGWVQEDWESGLTVFLNAPSPAGGKVSLELVLEGDFLEQGADLPCSFPRDTIAWYPRHGFLNRSTYDLAFRHGKDDTVASVGLLAKQAADPEDPAARISQWRMDVPVPIISFEVGRFERKTDKVRGASGEVPLEFYSLPDWALYIKDDFVMAELGNTMKYYEALYGPFPYPKIAAVFFPNVYGQGVPSLLLLPKADRTSRYTFSFISHECSHQWWGGGVAWRSYRDQWLSEGFANYSGVLYTAFRDKGNSWRELVKEMRDSLAQPPVNTTGVGSGKLSDIGPLIQGRRLRTGKTLQAYNSLIYDKGGLVVRMLHFLFTDPGSGNDKAFFDMLKDFLAQYKGGRAATEDLARLAGERFAGTPVARKYGLKDLNWFFRQWVYQAELPSYRLKYAVESRPEGGFLLKGTVEQENAPDQWFMPLPLVINVGKDRYLRGTVAARGASCPFSIPLPEKPVSVALDPDLWVLSAKTTTEKL